MVTELDPTVPEERALGLARLHVRLPKDTPAEVVQTIEWFDRIRIHSGPFDDFEERERKLEAEIERCRYQVKKSASPTNRRALERAQEKLRELHAHAKNCQEQVEQIADFWREEHSAFHRALTDWVARRSASTLAALADATRRISVIRALGDPTQAPWYGSDTEREARGKLIPQSCYPTLREVRALVRHRHAPTLERDEVVQRVILEYARRLGEGTATRSEVPATRRTDLEKCVQAVHDDERGARGARRGRRADVLTIAKKTDAT